MRDDTNLRKPPQRTKGQLRSAIWQIETIARDELMHSSQILWQLCKSQHTFLDPAKKFKTQPYVCPCLNCDIAECPKKKEKYNMYTWIIIIMIITITTTIISIIIVIIIIKSTYLTIVYLQTPPQKKPLNDTNVYMISINKHQQTACNIFLPQHLY